MGMVNQIEYPFHSRIKVLFTLTRVPHFIIQHLNALKFLRDIFVFRCICNMYGKQLLALPCVSAFVSTWNNSAKTRWAFFKFDIYFLKICQENSSFIKI